LFSQDLNITNWSWAPLDKRKLFQGIIISVLFCWSSIHQLQTKTMQQMSMYDQLIAKQQQKTQMIWWSNFVICEFKSLNILIPFYLPQTINIWFHEVVRLCYHGRWPWWKSFVGFAWVENDIPYNPISYVDQLYWVGSISFESHIQHPGVEVLSPSNWLYILPF